MCPSCSGSGLLPAPQPPKPDTTRFPHLAIIGGGIGGTALAVACLHRGIPFTLYERDTDFAARAQGYGLTLQQAHTAVKGFGIDRLEQGIVSTRHIAHTPDGTVLGEWGMRKWDTQTNATPKRTNIHIARQNLRLALLNQLSGTDAIRWGHQLNGFKQTETGIELQFDIQGNTSTAQADLLVGADGIRSSVRALLFEQEPYPLRYLDCIVILGICALSPLKNTAHELLDQKTVFQTANGNERMYMMPYDPEHIMWQFSYPLAEAEAKSLSAQGAEALKKEVQKRTDWHAPIPQIINATPAALISGYPVYDRALLTPQAFTSCGPVSLLGDAAHPMSPFKGQGANQALLDALALARRITKMCKPDTSWKQTNLRKKILTPFETEMLDRSATKVKASARAARVLHSDQVLQERDGPRGGGKQ
ncbi:FAD-dependent oxidoreductase [Leeuwenhoekiella blandensis]|uniref:FAD-dependent oxidoreductase n=1 Tax=Leeuwenhoekiella blandensis TaxID=360293 RepID=UPI001E53DAB4|nr:NAD(P)/FAD-dependent oxidoreductase [Leeuwenhoekiella blandensis]